jgi:chromosome segregation ATPase
MKIISYLTLLIYFNYSLSMDKLAVPKSTFMNVKMALAELSDLNDELDNMSDAVSRAREVGNVSSANITALNSELSRFEVRIKSLNEELNRLEIELKQIAGTSVKS